MLTKGKGSPVAASVTFPRMVRVWQREDYGLTTGEKDELRLSWYRKIVRNAPLIEKRFLQTLR